MNMKHSILATSILIALQANTGYAVIYDDVEAPSSVTAPSITADYLNVGSYSTQIYQDASTGSGQINTGDIHSSTVSTGSLTTGDLEVTGQLTGLNSFDADNITSDYLTVGNATYIYTDSTTGAGQISTGDISSSTVNTGSITTGSLTTGNLEVTGQLTGLNSFDADNITSDYLTVGNATYIYTDSDGQGYVQTGTVDAGKVRTSDLEVYNNLKTANLEVTGQLTGISNFQADTISTGNGSTYIYSDSSGQGFVQTGTVDAGKVRTSDLEVSNNLTTGSLTTGNLEVTGQLTGISNFQADTISTGNYSTYIYSDSSGQGYVQTGTVDASKVRTSDLEVYNKLTTANLEVTGQLTGINSFDADNINADSFTVGHGSTHIYTDTTTGSGQINTGNISSNTIKTSDLEVYNNLKAANLEVTGQLTGLSSFDADNITANQNIALIKDGVSVFTVSTTTDSTTGTIVGNTNISGNVQVGNLQASSIDVVNDLSTNNLTVRGQLSVKDLNLQNSNIHNVADATTDDQAVNLKQLKQGDIQALADAKTYTDNTATTLRSEAQTETTRVNKAISDGDTATLTAANKNTADTATAIRKDMSAADTKTLNDAKTYTDTTATTLRDEAAIESARVDQAISDGDTATLTAANKNTADTATAIRKDMSAADTKILNDAKTYTDTTATTLRDEAAIESARVDQAISDGDTATLTAANKNTADTATAIRTDVAKADAQVLSSAKNHTTQVANQTLNTAKQYTDASTSSMLAEAKAYTDANADGSMYIDVQNTDGATAANAEGDLAVAIGSGSVASGNQSIAIGVGNQVSGNGSGAFGDPNVVTGNASYAFGNDNTVSGDNTFVLGNDVSTTATNAVVLGNGSASTRNNTVSVGASGNERQIINVAAGTAETDAVNVKQMTTANAMTLSSANTYTDTTATALRSEAATETIRVNTALSNESSARISGDAATLASAQSYVDNKVGQFSRKLDDIEKTSYRGIAIALAAQQAMPSIQAGQVAVFGGVGHYEGETAGALGAVTSFTDRLSGSGAFGFSDGGHFGGRVGIAYVFGGN